MEKPNQFVLLVDAIASLPGVGQKAASRIAYHLLKKDRRYAEEFVQRIVNARHQLSFCKKCGNVAGEDLCSICSNSSRNTKLLCVVATIEDIYAIEKAGAYDGLYHVLNGEISPRKNVNPEDLRLASLLDRVADEDIQELIVATNPTIEGEATANYIKSALVHQKGLSITRIATGLPMNSNIDYADSFTLTKALSNRRKL